MSENQHLIESILSAQESCTPSLIKAFQECDRLKFVPEALTRLLPMLIILFLSEKDRPSLNPQPLPSCLNS